MEMKRMIKSPISQGFRGAELKSDVEKEDLKVAIINSIMEN